MLETEEKKKEYDDIYQSTNLELKANLMKEYEKEKKSNEYKEGKINASNFFKENGTFDNDKFNKYYTNNLESNFIFSEKDPIRIIAEKDLFTKKIEKQNYDELRKEIYCSSDEHKIKPIEELKEGISKSKEFDIKKFNNIFNAYKKEVSDLTKVEQNSYNFYNKTEIGSNIKEAFDSKSFAEDVSVLDSTDYSRIRSVDDKIHSTALNRIQEIDLSKTNFEDVYKLTYSDMNKKIKEIEEERERLFNLQDTEYHKSKTFFDKD